MILAICLIYCDLLTSFSPIFYIFIEGKGHKNKAANTLNTARLTVTDCLLSHIKPAFKIKKELDSRIQIWGMSTQRHSLSSYRIVIILIENEVGLRFICVKKLGKRTSATTVVLVRHGNTSCPTGNQEYRGNSYCEVRDPVFILDSKGYKTSHKWRHCSQFQLLIRLEIIAWPWPGGLSMLTKACCTGCS